MEEKEGDDNDLTGFEPMPPLPEHDVASLSSYNKEHIYDKSDTGSDISDDDDNENDDSADDKRLALLSTRSSIVSNITEVFPKSSIPGDSLPLRVMLDLLTHSVAVIVPNVQALISLAGAIAGSSTTLLTPPC